jgi:biotin carboxyl carrier protein
MRHSSAVIVVLTGLFTIALPGCGQQAAAPARTGTPIGAAAADAEARAAADAKAAELATKEKELADREAALAQQELAAAQQAAADAKTKADALKAANAKKVANKPASNPKPATMAAKTAAAPTPIVVPAGTALAVELTANVNTKRVKVGDPVQARLASDVVIDGRRAAKAGTTVSGSVSQVVSGSDRIGGIPTLGLTFDTLVAADGSTRTINASYVTQGKSETGKDTAKILGGAAAGAVVGHQVDDDKGAVIGGLLGAGAGAAAAKKTGGDIKLLAGEVLQVTTATSFEVKT